MQRPDAGELEQAQGRKGQRAWAQEEGASCKQDLAIVLGKRLGFHAMSKGKGVA